MALTKKIVIDPIAIPILASMEWSSTSDHTIVGKLTCGQLDRKSYVAINKSLEALGGKWNKKLGGHVFTTDPRGSIPGALEAGTIEVVRDGYFKTPHDIGCRMARDANLMPFCVVVEPSAGTGELASAILSVEPTAQIICGEKNAARVEVLKQKGFVARQWDFLTEDIHADYIIQNPPFEIGQDIDHVFHAYNCLNQYGVLVSIMSEGSFFREDKKATTFREWFSLKCGNSIQLGNGAFHESGTDVNTRIVIIRKV